MEKSKRIRKHEYQTGRIKIPNTNEVEEIISKGLESLGKTQSTRLARL